MRTQITRELTLFWDYTLSNH